ncbi:hypothetical protein FIBSPDRAFT_858896 [Athelia psychrophila]|uniref:Uncharacterized protein n=1 Tax=Athelia psychrophila TaxID=1759441 RepID=A0A166DJ31_9AGAM|nr:hypothetical protein FIBSPDRAFT_867897 [Fibularhizoctonia sp. CBS 109695]KZP23236.1 hypothetical protein FIBSPDRAFT_858896 [Fibularhizoctonia sp. CBS 109695]
MNATAQPPSLPGGAYPIATQVFPAHFSPAEFSSRYFVTGLPQTSLRSLFHYPGYTQAVCVRTRRSSPSRKRCSSRSASSCSQHPLSNLGPVDVVTGDKDFSTRACSTSSRS